MSEPVNLDKGRKMEEMLREYFLEMGYFVVRGPKYEFNGFDITDIDLWLYTKTSIFNRQRFNVDVKNKKSPQAMERILWAKGLQLSLHLDGAMVATTDSRSDVRQFGDKNDVVILDGNLLSKLKHRYANASRRLNEEDFLNLVPGDKSGDEWFDRFHSSKSKVLSHFDFDGCNTHLLNCKYFAEQALTVTSRKEICSRLFYYNLALLLITLDFILQDFAFLESPLQAEALTNGLRFGMLGKKGAEKIFLSAARIASAYLRVSNIRPQDLVNQLQKESMELPVEILVEYILKTNQNKVLFDLGRSFEALAFAANFEFPHMISAEQRGLIGVVLDFHQIDRKTFFSVFEPRSVDTVIAPVKSGQAELGISEKKASENPALVKEGENVPKPKA